jgi:hypothetical protein
MSRPIEFDFPILQAVRVMEIYDGMQRPKRMFLSIVVPCCNEEEGCANFIVR